MGWRAATFKGKSVWVEVAANGEPSAAGGRVPMRYSRSAGAKVYKAGLGGISGVNGEILTLDAGVSADKKASKKRGSGFGSAGTRTASQTAMAKADALAKLKALGADVHRAFTDGGCRGNPGPAGSGVRLELADGRVAELSRSLGRGTNNIAELTAVDATLDLLDAAGVTPTTRVVVFSDSSYVAGVLLKGWKAKKNTDLILGLRKRLEAWPGVEIVWVAGHAGIPGNERADALASAGVRGTTSTVWS